MVCLRYSGRFRQRGGGDAALLPAGGEIILHVHWTHANTSGDGLLTRAGLHVKLQPAGRKTRSNCLL